jgi:hypothetical protein
MKPTHGGQGHGGHGRGGHCCGKGQNNSAEDMVVDITNRMDVEMSPATSQSGYSGPMHQTDANYYDNQNYTETLAEIAVELHHMEYPRNNAPSNMNKGEAIPAACSRRMQSTPERVGWNFSFFHSALPATSLRISNWPIPSLVPGVEVNTHRANPTKFKCTICIFISNTKRN